MEDGVDVDQIGKMNFSTFESNVLFVLRFMIDTGVVGGSWVTAHAGKYSVGGGSKNKRTKLSTCQIDIHLSFRCGHYALVCFAVLCFKKPYRFEYSVTL
jgi:DNA polymerase elongation subunit (family B)